LNRERTDPPGKPFLHFVVFSDGLGFEIPRLTIGDPAITGLADLELYGRFTLSMEGYCTWIAGEKMRGYKLSFISSLRDGGEGFGLSRCSDSRQVIDF
jgi:hypothetical protein